MFGIAENEWERWVEGVTAFLNERVRLRRQTSYTEVNVVVSDRQGVELLDFSNSAHRSGMSHILRQVVLQDQEVTGSDRMLTALVIYLDENGPGPGFYELAVELGLLRRGANDDQKTVFWTGTVTALIG